jgi:hypothetical protein
MTVFFPIIAGAIEPRCIGGTDFQFTEILYKT